MSEDTTDALTLSDQLFIAAEECARHYLRHVFGVDPDPVLADIWGRDMLLGIEQRNALLAAPFGGEGA